MTQEELDSLINEQVKKVAEEAAIAIRHIVAVASVQIQSQIVNLPQFSQGLPMNLGIRHVPGNWQKD